MDLQSPTLLCQRTGCALRILIFWVFFRLCCEGGCLQKGHGGEEMGLTCHYSSNEHAHVGTERAGPEQAQGTVRFPAIGSNKDQTRTESVLL